MPLVDTIAAAAAVDVPAGVIRKWAYRGDLTRRGTDEKGRTLYDLQQVHDTAAAYRARAHERLKERT